MTEAEYNNAEGIRRSDLWRMEDSPEKFRWYLEHPVEQTPAMAFGAACHKWILEPTDWSNEYVIAPMIDRRTNAGKKEWAEFLDKNLGKTVVSQDDFDVMDGMSNALMSCELAGQLMYAKGRQIEAPLFWRDPETGERCKAKLDVLIKGYNGQYIIIDYKTTQHADMVRFNREIFSRGYYFQAGMYAEGLKTSLKLDYMPRFIFIAQEKTEPFAVNVIEVDWETMNAGRSKYHELLQLYHDCREADLWPGYNKADEINLTSMPKWAMNTDEEGE